MEDFADVLRILAPWLSTRRALLAGIQLEGVVALSIAAITAVVGAQSETDTGRTPALAVIDNRPSIVVKDQVTAQAVPTENSVRTENAEVPSIHEILVLRRKHALIGN